MLAHPARPIFPAILSPACALPALRPSPSRRPGLPCLPLTPRRRPRPAHVARPCLQTRARHPRVKGWGSSGARSLRDQSPNLSRANFSYFIFCITFHLTFCTLFCMVIYMVIPKVMRVGKHERRYELAGGCTKERPYQVGLETREQALSLYASAQKQAAGRRPWLQVALRDKTVYLWREDGKAVPNVVSTAGKAAVRVPKPESAKVEEKAEPTVLDRIQNAVAEKRVETAEHEVCRKPMGANVADMCPLETGHAGPHQHGRGFQK